MLNSRDDVYEACLAALTKNRKYGSHLQKTAGGGWGDKKKTSECALYITASLRVRVSFNERAVWYGVLIFIYRPKNR